MSQLCVTNEPYISGITSACGRDVQEAVLISDGAQGPCCVAW